MSGAKITVFTDESGPLACEWQDAKRLAGYEGVPIADVPGWVSDVWSALALGGVKAVCDLLAQGDGHGS